MIENLLNFNYRAPMECSKIHRSCKPRSEVFLLAKHTIGIAICLNWGRFRCGFQIFLTIFVIILVLRAIWFYFCQLRI